MIFNTHGEQMECSVIIPTYNAEGTIKKALIALQKQNYLKNKYEIIVVDDGSTDKTRKIASKFKRVKLISTKHRGPAVARNIGAKKSKGDILLFTDADCIPDKNWIKNIKNGFKNPKVAVVSGSIINGTNNIYANAIHFCWASSLNPKLHEEERMLATSANMAIKSEVFDEVEGFNKKMIMAEDSDLSVRICKKGYKIIYQPNAIITHIPTRTTFSSLLKHRFNHGVWESINMLKHKPFQPTSKYFSKNWVFMLLILPFLIMLSTIIVIKRNILYAPQVLFYLPLIFIGRFAWSLGVVKGTYMYNKKGA